MEPSVLHLKAKAGRMTLARVTVTATARLHFGFLDPSGRGTRPFGSFGLSLDRPRTRLSIEPAPAICAGGLGALRAQRYLEAIVESVGLDRGYVVKVEEEITPHAGLGSGTQLALAVGTAFSTLEGLGLSPQEIASRLGRGARSGIGIATFEHGGAVLDSGPRDGALPALVARAPFPDAWRAILIFDPSAEGLAGAGEMEAFEQLPAFPEGETDALWRRATEQALAAIASGDLRTFAEQVGDLQARMGEYFAPLQGGPYLSQGVADALAWLSGQGLKGLGQSSWGPTGFAFVSSEEEAEALLDRLRAATSDWKLRFALAKGRNEGALIETIPRENRSPRRPRRFSHPATSAKGGGRKQGDDWAMAPPRIIHMVTPLKHMSPFDVNMALDAGFDAAIPYTNVTTEDVYGLVQDAIFSRSPEGIKRTAMFIGGKRAIKSLDMLDRAKKAMVPPFEISVFADPAGSFTTAAAMVACAKDALKDKLGATLKGQRVLVYGGTGVVAFASAVIATSDGAKAILVGYDGPERVKKLALEIECAFRHRSRLRRRHDRGAEGRARARCGHHLRRRPRGAQALDARADQAGEESQSRRRRECCPAVGCGGRRRQ